MRVCACVYTCVCVCLCVGFEQFVVNLGKISGVALGLYFL